MTITVIVLGGIVVLVSVGLLALDVHEIKRK